MIGAAALARIGLRGLSQPLNGAAGQAAKTKA
jgi:hypothetical protein